MFCSNILAVAETHKKHVPIFNLCGVLCFPHLRLIMVTCFVKKERERERERGREGGRERERERGREGGKEGGRERETGTHIS